MKKLFITLTILVVVISSFYLFNRKDLDRFNPFIKQEYVYVQLNEAPENINGRYQYKLTGANESGKIKSVIFTTSTILDPSTYVKVLTKGLYTESYQIIEADDVPTN